MSEMETIDRVDFPANQFTLATDLRRLGLGPGMMVLVHTSLSALGWVCGGPVSVIKALIEVLGPDGTLIMPSHSGDLSDPAAWRNPPVPAAWVQLIRDTMPAYDPAWTPTRQMGCVAELFRTLPNVRRSMHPAESFAGHGPQAGSIIESHALAYCLGETSPLARLYDLDGHVLLLGVGYENNTSFHLAEYRVPERRPIRQGAPVHIDGRRVWVEYDDLELDDAPFGEIGQLFEATGAVSVGKVGVGTARLFKQRLAVDFATHWLKTRVESVDTSSSL
jgi:aminoglycoside 3-N-acetyltransferase